MKGRTMELDDFKQRWMEPDAIRINTRAVRAIVRAEDSLRRHWRNVTLELILDGILLLFTGSFVADHIREPRFLLPGLVLHLAVILLSAPLLRQLVLLRGVDYAEPVVAIRRQVERLRIEEIRALRWTLSAAPLLWTPLLIVTMKGLLGLDAWALLNTRWIFANLAFGIVFLAAMLWASRRIEGRWMDALAGRSLRVAKRHLEEVAQFAE
ncbi:MAG TPA: hypothetical protein VEK11_01910 [Thermoanaerobaculia bacterium]|nr:hypothetical protein [Thermoanaerobaculia bacterium]